MSSLLTTHKLNVSLDARLCPNDEFKTVKHVLESWNPNFLPPGQVVAQFFNFRNVNIRFILSGLSMSNFSTFSHVPPPATFLPRN
jgi:hypothetical protein